MARALKTLIAEDEQIGRTVPREELELLPEITVVGEAEDGADALRQVREFEPDLVFLDLNMPIMNGFEVVRNLSGSRLPVIMIVTAYHKHAIQTFEGGHRLSQTCRCGATAEAVDRARGLINRPLEAAENIAKIASLEKRDKAPRKLVGRVGRDFFLVDLDEVLAVQADRELVRLVT
jgi:DNA-binding LytR/AlgR family response regulator